MAMPQRSPPVPCRYNRMQNLSTVETPRPRAFRLETNGKTAAGRYSANGALEFRKLLVRLPAKTGRGVSGMNDPDVTTMHHCQHAKPALTDRAAGGWVLLAALAFFYVVPFQVGIR